jgi:hypothetical protein
VENAMKFVPITFGPEVNSRFQICQEKAQKLLLHLQERNPDLRIKKLRGQFMEDQCATKVPIIQNRSLIIFNICLIRLMRMHWIQAS